MKSHHLLHLFALPLFLIGVVSCCAATDAELGRWHKLQNSGVVIEYQDGLAGLARQLMPEAIRLAQDGPQAQCQREIDKLAPRKKQLLGFVASQLDLEKPSKESERNFDALLQMESGSPGPRYIRLWHRQALKEAVIARKGVRDVIYDPAHDKFVVYHHSAMRDDLPGSKGKPAVVAPAALSIPVDLSLAKPALDQAREYLDAQFQAIEPIGALHCFFHELSEGMIIAGTTLQGCFRRWFCDGVAEFVSEQCTGRFVGKPALEQYLAEQAARMEKRTPLRDQVDLVAWRAVEWESELASPMSGELADAHYVFAAYEVRELAERHGPGVLPKVFREIHKARAEEGRAILDAISKVTGEDCAARLSTYGSKSPDELRGLGFIKLVVVGYSGEEPTVITDGAEVPIVADDRHGLGAVVVVASLQYPLEVKWELSGASHAKWVGVTKERPTAAAEGESTSMVRYTMDALFSSGKLKPGDNTLSLYLQGKLARQVKFKLLAPPGS